MENIQLRCKKHLWPILILFTLIIISYLFISSDYSYLVGDAGNYARCAKIFFQEKRIEISHAAPVLLGQFFISNTLCALFGFEIKTLHISVFVVDFFLLLGMYFLLLEWGTDRFLALFGSLTLFVNPVTLMIIDSYFTEPFFMCYLVFSLLFFLKGLRNKNYPFLYLGGVFCGLAVLTRQYAVSVSVALILVSFLYWKKDKLFFLHSIISAAIPLITIGLFYLYLYFNRDIQAVVPSAYTAAKSSIFVNLTNPITFFTTLFFDSVIFLHYAVLFLTPLFIILLISSLGVFQLKEGTKAQRHKGTKNETWHKKNENHLEKNLRIKVFVDHLWILSFSFLYIFLGTFLLFLKNNRLMPYIPNVFSINSLTRIFSIKIAKPQTAAVILTIFTAMGAIVILFLFIEYFFSIKTFLLSKNKIPTKDNKKKNNKIGTNEDERQFDLGKVFFYLWGIMYFLLSSILILRYDRYIYPISLLVICIILSNFSYIKKYKKTFISVFLILFSIFSYKMVRSRLSQDAQWKAGGLLIAEGVASQRINAGLGFNHYHSFDYITDLYKNAKVNRPINWYKFHPMADFFVTGKKKLEEKEKGLVLYKTFTQKRLFGHIESTRYIYRRKEGYRKPVWI